ncbi:hypothetical protein B5V01_25935 [Mesorhizobium erdmanii]|uniref:Uncharacterized protein n=2 Tax=Mesorhizobium TaxID=68287 RepID=A0A3M9XII3_9HYPH|nr:MULTISPECIES: hypothetical protein [Mesorhizobium]RNJ47552.1 hypothetical protein DNR46_07070 [Mesorhizobium japonicum]RXT40620.1 hypothetical protein B5V01_25935 [Mesorhizobium erdmanii]
MAGENRYSPILVGIFLSQMLIGTLVVVVFLWMGKAIIPRHGGGLYVLDRVQDPYLYWGLLAGILFSLVFLPIRYLYQGPKR